MFRTLLSKPFFIRLFNWEYWPFNVVYMPVYLYWLWLSVRARSFFFFSTSNPTIKNAGFLLESKTDIYKLIPTEFYPATLFFKAGSKAADAIAGIRSKGISYPLICKPDVGMQGKAVKKIESEEELKNYIQGSTFDFLVQEFIDYEQEVGIFYYRYPGNENGIVSGIVQKKFLAVTGDGSSTIEALLKQDKRFILQLETLRNSPGINLDEVPVKGHEHILVPYGNHVRGAMFLDASHLIDEGLTNAINSFCKKIDGFYFGRLDIRFSNWDDLREGKNFSIIELNGAGSEPTHIYDPRHSIFFAWKEIIRHLNILSRISRMNHQQLNLSYMNTASGVQMFKDNKLHIKMLDNCKVG